jgi:hypothetical protein
MIGSMSTISSDNPAWQLTCRKPTAYNAPTGRQLWDYPGGIKGMVCRKVGNCMARKMLCMAWLFAAFLPLRAEMTGGLPIGRLATSGTVSVGSALAPTGTALFSGDRLSAQNSPAFIRFRSGSSVVLPRGSAATIYRKETGLLIRAEKGTLGFHFVPREEARIEAGRYMLTSSARDAAEVGELVVDADGRIAMALSSGSFSAFDAKSGQSFNVSAQDSGKAGSQSAGSGSLVNDTNTFSDAAQRWAANGLRGKCIVARGEAHRILSNQATTLTLQGTWLLFSDTYKYAMTECSAQALADAGAIIGVEEALKEPPAPKIPAAPKLDTPPVQTASTGMSRGAKTGIIVGVAGGAAAGVAVAVSRKSKSQ